eukprot:TRINITY_DN4678_c0_g2_i2.p1 TRINITY_DN4678_c0_g2~~TRINITY_DN4678_c0_g2_i2.p1  ORF type:complete len:526 (-),score=103.22 TRINITY_DN4678_c0_g2_i2:331-1908(-)
MERSLGDNELFNTAQDRSSCRNESGSCGGKYSEFEDRISNSGSQSNEGRVEQHGRILFEMLHCYEDGSLFIHGFKALLTTVEVESLVWKNEERYTSLEKAVEEGQSECLKELLKVSKYEYREVLTSKGGTLLHIAAAHGDIECLKMLLEDSKPNYREVKGFLGQTPLLSAIHNDHLDCVKELLTGSRPEYREIIQGEDGNNTALHLAAFWNKPDHVAELLNDSRPEYREMVNKDGSSALHLHFDLDFYFDNCQERDSNPRPVPELQEMDNNNDVIAPDFEFDEDFDVDYDEDAYEEQIRKPRCVTELLKNARPGYREMRNNDGRTALHFAVMFNRIPVESVKELLKDSRPEYREILDNDGRTALHTAVMFDEIPTESVKELLKDSRPEYRQMLDKNGNTALHWAGYSNNRHQVAELLKDSTPEYREMVNKDGNTALHRRFGFEFYHDEDVDLRCVKELLRNSRPGYREAVNNDGNTALHLAVCLTILLIYWKIQDLNIVKWLINEETQLLKLLTKRTTLKYQSTF